MKRVLAAFVVGLLAAVSFAVPANAAPKILYLTFDDGPSHPANTRAVLRELAAVNGQATFFVVGLEVRQHPITYSRLWQAGHKIANHSYSHAKLTSLTNAQIRSQISRTERLIGAQAGRCMRPPYGATNSRVKAVINSMGFKQTLWHASYWDYKRPNYRRLADRIVNNARHGQVVLLHDGGEDGDNTARALHLALPRLRAQGYVFRAMPGC